MLAQRFTIESAREAIRTKEISAKELTDIMLGRIVRTDSALNAYISINREGAEKDAERIDALVLSGQPLPPLAGIPISLKDLFDVEGQVSTYGGRHFKNHYPAQSATVVKKLQAAGAIIVGKTNLHEYAYGTTTENPHFGNTKNPWNRSKIPGGSSGGSSVSIVSGTALGSLGTDTGGSVRIPASLTGHVGLKPTFGLVSKSGVFPLATSLDHVGPMGKTVQDVALLLSVIAGFDARDEQSVRTSGYQFSLGEPSERLDGLRLGVPRQFFYDRCHTSVLQVVLQTLSKLESRGADLIEVDIPHIYDVPDAQTATISSEALDVHRELLKQPDLYGGDVLRRLEAARELTGADYVRALRFRREFVRGLNTIFGNKVDFLITPTTPLTATDIGQFKAHIKAHEVNVRGHLTRNTNPWNLSGLPAISLPCGTSPDGLPVGLQIIGSAFSEKRLLQMAHDIEYGLAWDALAPDYRGQ